MDSRHLRGLGAANKKDYEKVEEEKGSTRSKAKPGHRTDLSLELLSSGSETFTRFDCEEDETMKMLCLAQDSAFAEHDSYFVFSLVMKSMGHFYLREPKKKKVPTAWPLV
eukprot:TRINITY_DN4987_c0_g1_i1.p1 TRINITY_DN4987_c0_g1~~TRINITY_DN4987_c0_g1_i1.p1  ORF type:complete len:121 (+),score=33.31 TRINITY_DN4987_c0_g1_i1:34-363(+)